MTGRDEIREAILGAAEGATGSMQALGAAGLAAALEDFDVEVSLSSNHLDDDKLALEVRFSIVVQPRAETRRSVA